MAKKIAKKKAVKKKKIVKKAKKKALNIGIAPAQKKKIQKTLSDMEAKIIANYEKAVKMSGADWKKESKKFKKIAKKDAAFARKKIESEIRKNPAGAAVAAAAVSAVAGAFLMSVLRKK